MPPRRPTPIGFMVLGMAMALLTVICAAALADGESGRLARLLLALVATLSLVAAEALWWVRPWLTRVVDAWALACTSAVLVAGAVTFLGPLEYGGIGLLATLALCFVGMPCALVRWYVRDHAAALGILPSAGRPVHWRAPGHAP